MVGTPTMLQPGNIQIVNVRPPNAPQTQNHQQKTVAAVQPRVVIGNPQTIIRPGGNVSRTRPQICSQCVTLSQLNFINRLP